MPTKLFYDSEFTELSQSAQLISIALVSGQGDSFYAEFCDTPLQNIDPWLQQNVVNNTLYIKQGQQNICVKEGHAWQIADSHATVSQELASWLSAFEQVEIWADCLAYDWVLFCQLFGGAMQRPKNIHYMPGDLATLFRLKGLDPDTSREQFATLKAEETPLKHNALWDAEIARRCYHKLLAEPWPTP